MAFPPVATTTRSDVVLVAESSFLCVMMTKAFPRQSWEITHLSQTSLLSSAPCGAVPRPRHSIPPLIMFTFLSAFAPGGLESTSSQCWPSAFSRRLVINASPSFTRRIRMHVLVKRCCLNSFVFSGDEGQGQIKWFYQGRLIIWCECLCKMVFKYWFLTWWRTTLINVLF